MHFHILTIFPDIFDSYINKGMLRIALEKKIVEIKTHNLRDFAVNTHGQVDEKPYGGGPGQVLMIEPVYKALRDLKSKSKNSNSKTKKSKIVLFSAKGKKWNQQLAQKYSKLDEVIFVCPRYEGHDERIRKIVDEEISLGDFILTGGELGAMVVIDSVTRLLPGVLGKVESLKEESHSLPGYLEYPHYTRPEVFEIEKKIKRKTDVAAVANVVGVQHVEPQQRKPQKRTVKLRVPKILLSGHHAKIEEWRKKKSKNAKHET